ncbi:MAG: hypothetical protein ACU0CI_06010 [Shimia sp.]
MAVALAFGSGLAAEPFNCTFTQECFEGEACVETAFTLATDGSTIITDAETLRGVAMTADGQRIVSVVAGGQTALLSIAADAARYSVHFNADGFAIHYIGTCEAP